MREHDVPAAVTSERAVLGAVMWAPSAMAEARKLISDEDWYLPTHRALWQIILDLEAAGTRPEPSAVVQAVTKLQPSLAQLVADLATNELASSAAIGHHCAQMLEASTKRALFVALQRGYQQAAEGTAEPVATAEDIISELRIVQKIGTAGQASPTSLDVWDIAGRELRAEDWIVPGLLARWERLILTAPEGYGKSTLLRQIAVCIAAGIHPFNPAEVIEPRRVYVHDAENPQKINTDEYRKVLEFLDIVGAVPARGMLTINEVGPSNLLDPRQAGAFLSEIDRVKPDIIIAGPIYQLHEGNPNDEEPARKLAGVLDRARMTHGSALLLEAHTPHNDGPSGQMLRPFGASLWKRWPEFGYCLHPLPEAMAALRQGGEAGHIARVMRESAFTPWRGTRASGRRWPLALAAGSRLPWEEQPL